MKYCVISKYADEFFANKYLSNFDKKDEEYIFYNMNNHTSYYIPENMYNSVYVKYIYDPLTQTKIDVDMSIILQNTKHIALFEITDALKHAGYNYECKSFSYVSRKIDYDLNVLSFQNCNDMDIFYTGDSISLCTEKHTTPYVTSLLLTPSKEYTLFDILKPLNGLTYECYIYLNLSLSHGYLPIQLYCTLTSSNNNIRITDINTHIFNLNYITNDNTHLFFNNKEIELYVKDNGTSHSVIVKSQYPITCMVTDTAYIDYNDADMVLVNGDNDGLILDISNCKAKNIICDSNVTSLLRDNMFNNLNDTVNIIAEHYLLHETVEISENTNNIDLYSSGVLNGKYDITDDEEIPAQFANIHDMTDIYNIPYCLTYEVVHDISNMDAIDKVFEYMLIPKELPRLNALFALYIPRWLSDNERTNVIDFAGNNHNLSIFGNVSWSDEGHLSFDTKTRGNYLVSDTFEQTRNRFTIIADRTLNASAEGNSLGLRLVYTLNNEYATEDLSMKRSAGYMTYEVGGSDNQLPLSVIPTDGYVWTTYDKYCGTIDLKHSNRNIWRRIDINFYKLNNANYRLPMWSTLRSIAIWTEELTTEEIEQAKKYLTFAPRPRK